MEYDRPIVLCLAGYDPTGGAGVLADVKTVEQHACLGMAVITAITVQTEDACIQVKWQTIDQIKAAITPLLENYSIQWVKIGMIENIETLLSVCRFLKAINPGIHIIWDSVVASSGGFTFIDHWEPPALISLYSMLYLITPNADEVKLLTRKSDEQQAAISIAAYCSVLVTGGHRQVKKGEDLLFFKKQVAVLKPGVPEFADKHGTGCILSSAITANLANGYSLEEACIQAKHYIERIANSNKNRLAYHYDTRK